MKSFQKTMAGLTMAAAVLLGTGASTAQAATTWGKVTFVGTVAETNVNGVYNARMRIRVSGTCDTDGVVKDRWVIISSGRMDGAYAHNGVNMKNAYSTLMTALVSGKNVQIDALSTCSNAAAINLNLWSAQIGIY